MAITEDGRTLPVTHVYRHPQGHGLGRHHAGADLSARPATPGVPLAHLLPEHRVTMADLDMADGQELAHVGADPDSGRLIFAWVDKCGTQRRTSLTPDQAAGFTVAPGKEG